MFSSSPVLNDHLSEHFTLAEALFSRTASISNIDNTPKEAIIIPTMMATAARMESVRTALGGPIHIDSWYRCLQLNRALGSKDTSQHLKGEAVDFICPKFGTPEVIVKHLVSIAEIIKYDQLILEHDWVHISFSILNGKPRNQVLSLLQSGSYAIGITDKLGKSLA